jgi:hypothetical protein
MPDPLMGLHPSELCSPHVAVRRLRRRSPRDVCTPQTNTTADDISPRTEARCVLPPETIRAPTCDRNRSLCTARHGVAASSPLAPKRAPQREPRRIRSLSRCRRNDVASMTRPHRPGVPAPKHRSPTPKHRSTTPVHRRAGTEAPTRQHRSTNAPAPKHRRASAAKRRPTAEQHRVASWYERLPKHPLEPELLALVLPGHLGRKRPRYLADSVARRRSWLPKQPRARAGQPWSPGSVLAFRGLLPARIRSPATGGLDRQQARSSPGLHTLQGSLPRHVGTAFTPCFPSWVSPLRSEDQHGDPPGYRP